MPIEDNLLDKIRSQAINNRRSMTENEKFLLAQVDRLEAETATLQTHCTELIGELKEARREADMAKEHNGRLRGELEGLHG